MTKIITALVKQMGTAPHVQAQRTLYLVSGSTAALGQSYIQEISKLPKADTVSLYRTASQCTNGASVQVDLLNKEACERCVSELDTSKYERIVFIHPVGTFQFERHGPKVDANNDHIDDVVYQSNVETFTNILMPLTEKLQTHQHLTVVAFGSVSDKYNVPFWASYTASKNVLRKIIEVASHKSSISGVFVNVSTVDTGNENKLRPYPQDKQHWLSVEDIVKETLPRIMFPISQYLEMDIYKESPQYKDNFYTNHQEVLNRWLQQMNTKYDAEN